MLAEAFGRCSVFHHHSLAWAASWPGVLILGYEKMTEKPRRLSGCADRGECTWTVGSGSQEVHFRGVEAIWGYGVGNRQLS